MNYFKHKFYCYNIIQQQFRIIFSIKNSNSNNNKNKVFIFYYSLKYNTKSKHGMFNIKMYRTV